MNNQVPNTDPSLSDEQVVRHIYETAICVYGVTRWEVLEFKGTHHVLGIGKTKKEAWADARSKLPAAVSEVDGGTQAEVVLTDSGKYSVYIPCSIEIADCHDENIADWICKLWNAKESVASSARELKSSSGVGSSGGIVLGHDPCPHIAPPDSFKPVAPQGTVEGETRQFRKKPVVIQAIQWTGSNLEELQSWGAPATILPATNRESLIIGTLEDGPNSEAVHVASLNDWIIRGIKGEFYPCKPDVFEGTYEAESVAPPSVAMQDILTDNCVLCGFEKDDHYDGVQCPIAHGKYHATQVFSSRIDAPLVPNPQKLLTELPALNVSNDDLVKACDTWRGEEDKYEIQAEVYCRERQLLAALNEIETLRPLAIMVAKSSGEGSGVPALEVLRQIKQRIHFIGMPQEKKTEDVRPDWSKEIAMIEAALSSPLQAEHALQSSVSNGAVDPDERWAEVACACGERWKAMGNGSLAWVNKRFNEHVQTVTPPDTKGGS